MIDKILEYYRTSDYDFREFAFEGDPLKGMFDQWVNYYRMKWAIAKAVNAKSILEIGVRYGYSAHAFLSALPGASYLGADADEPSFGGEIGAVDWAKNALQAKGFDVTLLKENTQNWSRLPGRVFDLTHIDGQQDGDGTYHDLDLAAMQSRHILVDGYHWTRQNFQAVNEWLWYNRAAVEFSTNIPGYAGDLLIRIKLDSSALEEEEAGSAALIQAYTEDYYLNDCGGYDQWHSSRGALLNARLQAVADVGMVIRSSSPSKVVDLGAGRGELSAYFARHGAEVTAIDYSPDAERLIMETLGADEALRKRVAVMRGSATNPAMYEDEYDLAVAADIVEHLAPDELDLMYGIVSEKLKPLLGSLIVHTAPNKWNYQYQHPRDQKVAISAGFWIPRIRRTWYERLMHINEQSPRVLKKQLARFFPHIHVWLSGAHGAGGSLIHPYTIQDCRQATSIFAIASHRPIDIRRVAATLGSEPFSSDESSAIDFVVVDMPRDVEVGTSFDVVVKVCNRSDRRIASLPPYPYHLSYHWVTEDGGVVQWDGLRTHFVPSLPPDAESLYMVKVQAPVKAGTYCLEVAAVQETVRWHEAMKCADTRVRVHDRTVFRRGE